ncbi:MAG: ATP-binding cassette domain-containing protein, partial [Bacteroidota bacterium]|nr:ATP-binding cassette domain-containing protein [Bacteroidota bacterium]
EIRRKVGYLPENNPLYVDMYVKEYLGFVAGIYKLPNQKSRIDEMIQLTGLEREAHKKIGALSKGYRQRVGLAQALIHNPEVLILDEPTSGLDPNQLEEIRSLIKNISHEKTVMLSTHIMQEVEALCQRVIVINHGELVADNNIQELVNHIIPGKQKVYVEFDSPVDAGLIKTVPGILAVEPAGENSWNVTSDHDCRKDLFLLAVSNNLVILSLHEQQRKLENIFHELTM